MAAENKGAGGGGATVFNAGGPGYVLNRAALRKLAGALDTQACNPRLKTFAEDVQVAKCLRSVGIVSEDTRDASGAERFHPFRPSTHLRYVPSSAARDWYGRYTREFALLSGIAFASRSSVSFHYCTAENIRQFDWWLRICPAESRTSASAAATDDVD